MTSTNYCSTIGNPFVTNKEMLSNNIHSVLHKIYCVDYQNTSIDIGSTGTVNLGPTVGIDGSITITSTGKSTTIYGNHKHIPGLRKDVLEIDKIDLKFDFDELEVTFKFKKDPKTGNITVIPVNND